jgi:hypothetical protein
MALALGGLGWHMAAGADATPLLALELRARQPAQVVCHALAQPLRAGASEPMMQVAASLGAGQVWHYVNGVNGWARWRALAPGAYDYVVTCAAVAVEGGRTQRLHWRGRLQR